MGGPSGNSREEPTIWWRRLRLSRSPAKRGLLRQYDANRHKSRGWRCRHCTPAVGRVASRGATRPRLGGGWGVADSA